MYQSFKAIIAAAFLLLVLPPSCFAEGGLAERRAIKKYQDTKFVDLKKDIDAAAGFDVPMTVEWDKLALEGQADNYMQDGFLTNIYFTPLAKALKDITVDEMGKAALKDKLKGIKINFDEATAPSSNYANGLKFENGMLAINFKPWSNADDISERAEAIQKLLESNL